MSPEENLVPERHPSKNKNQTLHGSRSILVSFHALEISLHGNINSINCGWLPTCAWLLIKPSREDRTLFKKPCRTFVPLNIGSEKVIACFLCCLIIFYCSHSKDMHRLLDSQTSCKQNIKQTDSPQTSNTETDQGPEPPWLLLKPQVLEIWMQCKYHTCKKFVFFSKWKIRYRLRLAPPVKWQHRFTPYIFLTSNLLQMMAVENQQWN